MQSQAENLEKAVSSARVRRQDKKNPHLISMTDFMLFPNVPRLRENKDMILYTGNLKAGLEERRRYVESMKTGRGGLRAVVDTSEPFDVGTASAQDLVDFALIEYGTQLKTATPLAALRKQVVNLAKDANALVTTSAAKQEQTEDIS